MYTESQAFARFQSATSRPTTIEEAYEGHNLPHGMMTLRVSHLQDSFPLTVEGAKGRRNGLRRRRMIGRREGKGTPGRGNRHWSNGAAVMWQGKGAKIAGRREKASGPGGAGGEGGGWRVLISPGDTR